MALADHLRIALMAVLGLSIVFNALFLVFTVRRKIGTRLCTILLRCQAVVDLLLVTANLIFLQFKAFMPELSQSASDMAWYIYCKIYPSQVVYWSLVCMSVYSIICVSVERCICLCYPFWYRLNRRKLLFAFYAVIAVSPFLVEAPFCLISRNIVFNTSGNGTVRKFCLYTFNGHQAEKVVSIAYVTLFWLLPFSLIVILYLCIICRIRKSAGMRAMSAATRDGSISAAARKLTLTTGVTAAAFVLLFALDSVTLLLGNLNITVKVSMFFDELDSFLVSMNSVVNPLIFLIFMPDFRHFLFCRELQGLEGRKISHSGAAFEMLQASAN